LTPGAWTQTGHSWDGFFNPGFFPSLIFRTVTAMTIAALAGCVVINLMPELDREQQTELINKAAHFLAPMALMPVLAVWYVGTMPADSRALALGGSVVMSMFLGLSIVASLAVGLYGFFGLLRRKLYVNTATSALLCSLSFAAVFGSEFVREGVRKPYTIRGTLFANSLTPVEIEYTRKHGCVTADPYPLQNPDDYPNDQVRLGAKVFRFHCSVCHTMDGANAVTHLAGSWSADQKRMNIAMLQRTKTFMPPFAGTADELEALVQMISWHVAGRPRQWALSDEPEVRKRIQRWLDEVGTRPGIELLEGNRLGTN
jgi:mono/diheme cytochrome c family protein